MEKIQIKKLSDKELENMGIFSWPIWEKEVSHFNWHYDSVEECFFLEGKIKVTPAGGEPVEFGTGDFVIFPAGMDCVWEISEAVRKHYNFK